MLLLARAAFALLLSTSYPAVAQVVVPDPAAEKAEEVVDFSGWRDSRMTVPVSIDGSGPFHFLVDTGAERTVLSEEVALTLGLASAGSAELHSVSGIGRVETVSVGSLAVSARPVLNFTAPVLKKRNLGAEGILGIDTLQRHRIFLDFRAETMTVSPSAKTPDPRLDDDDTIVIKARNRLGRLILVDASVGSNRVSIIIDTGAEYSIGNALLRKRVLSKQPRALILPANIVSVTGDTVPAEITRVNEMRIGGVTLTDMPIAFADLPIFRQLGLDRKPAMLLGMNTLRAFNQVSIDFANRKVHFVVPGETRLGEDTQLANAD